MEAGFAPRGLSLSAVVARLLTLINDDPTELPYIPTAQKAQASGVPSLDGSSLVEQAIKLVRTTAPGNTAGAIGVNGNELLFGVGAAQRNAERLDRKGAASGYAGLDVSSLVEQAVKLLRTTAPGTAAGAVGVHAGELKFGDGAAEQVAERQARRGAASGYASLDSSSRVEQSVKVVRATAPGTGAGAIGVDSGDLKFGTGSVEEVVERVTRKGQVNGYAGLNGSGQVTAPLAAGIPLSGATAFRKIGNGTTNIAGAATITLGTFTRNANEQLSPTMWVQQNVASLGFAPDRAAIGAEGISLFFERTVNANEFTVRAINNNVTTARDVEWAVYGIIP